VLLRDAQFAHGEFSPRTLADRAFRRVKLTPSKEKDRDRMGEAKRRRQQPAERTETVIELDEKTKEERRVETIVRDGGSVGTFLKKGLNAVPCDDACAATTRVLKWSRKTTSRIWMSKRRRMEAKRSAVVKTEAAFILGLRDARFTLIDREDAEPTSAGYFHS
jgi:hypothetical protein